MKNLDNLASELITFKNSQGLKASGTILKLSRNYTVFEIYNPYSIVQLSEVLQDVQIFRARTNIYDGRATIANIVNTGVVLIVTATLSDSSWKDSVDVYSKENIEKEINYLIDGFEQQQEIDVDFKLSILNLKLFLSDVKNWLDKFEPSLENTNIEINQDFIRDNYSALFFKIRELIEDIRHCADKIPKDKLPSYNDFVRNQLHDFFMSSPFPYRAYYKPLGFAGDYMMMHMIQRENAEGPNLYAKFMNVFYTNIPIATSVKNRTAKLIELIEEGVKRCEAENRDFHSISIGCGPALEIKKFIENNNPKVNCYFTLLDFNEETLNFASSEARKVVGNKSCHVNTILRSVHSLLKDSIFKGDVATQYDFVYCSGLFDYLSDKVCSRLTKMFFRWLKKDGKVLVTNMHSNDKDRHMTELLLEWYLIYRNENDMNNFAPNIGDQKIFTDSTGVNLCLEIANN